MVLSVLLAAYIMAPISSSESSSLSSSELLVVLRGVLATGQEAAAEALVLSGIRWVFAAQELCK